MVRSNRKTSGGGSCCRGQRGGNAHRRQCGAGRKRQSAGEHCHGGHATTQSGGDASRRQCGAGYSFKLNGGKHCTGQAGGHVHNKQYGGARKSKGKRGSRKRSRGKGKKRKRGSRKNGGGRPTYALRGGACDASLVDIGHTLDLSQNIRGRAAVVRQRGGEGHDNLKYDCSQPEWGPECR